MQETMANLSFADLQKTATSLADITRWCEANPSAVLGETVFPERASIKFTVQVNQRQLLKRAVEHGDVLASIKANVFYEISSVFGLDTEYVSSSNKPVVCFDVDSSAPLALEKWPVATALLAEEFVYQDCASQDILAYTILSVELNKNLNRHFPGWTLDRLTDIYKLGLIAPEDELTPGALCAVLFTGQAKTASVSVPDDVAQP